MRAETQILQQISEPNQIEHIRPRIEENVKSDLELAIKEGAVVFEIKMDIFKSSLSLEDSIKLVVKDENIDAVRKSIEDSKNDWFDCLKKANGDYNKARKLYNDY